MDGKLELKFDSHTIEHLGIKMYSRMPNALAELIANGYDANAENVKITFYDNEENKEIVIEDDGDGMSFDDINREFLVIGRKRREQDEARTNRKGRIITGKKGLGKLALFGIGKTIEITTSCIGEKYETFFTLDWDDLLGTNNGTYEPKFNLREKDDDGKHGTKIVLKRLTRISGFDIDNIVFSLNRLFDFYDATFKVTIVHRDKQVQLDKRKIYDSIEVEHEWLVEDVINKVGNENEYIKTIKGKIYSSKKPMKQNLRGITVYSNGRLVNAPGFFGLSEAGHVFSYLSGWIDADYLDEFNEEYIATDRQSLNWDLEETVLLQTIMQKVIKQINKEWSELRKQKKDEDFKERTKISKAEWLEKVPNEIRDDLDSVISTIYNNATEDGEQYSNTIEKLHKLLPPYTYLHYRLLHNEIQSASKKGYEEGNFYSAFQEGMKRYKDNVKKKSKVEDDSDREIMSKSFGKDSARLKTTKNYEGEFSKTTLGDIEEGQKFLSMGVVAGGRNPISHEEIQKLKSKKLFTERDCLDMLSILSHLHRRLDEC